MPWPRWDQVSLSFCQPRLLFRVWFSFNSAHLSQPLFVQRNNFCFVKSSNAFLDCFPYSVKVLRFSLYPKFGDLRSKWQSAGTLNSEFTRNITDNSLAASRIWQRNDRQWTMFETYSFPKGTPNPILSNSHYLKLPQHSSDCSDKRAWTVFVKYTYSPQRNSNATVHIFTPQDATAMTEHRDSVCEIYSPRRR